MTSHKRIEDQIENQIKDQEEFDKEVNAIIVRLGEITLKSRSKKEELINKIIKGIRKKINELRREEENNERIIVKNIGSKIIVRRKNKKPLGKELQKIIKSLKEIRGIESISPAIMKEYQEFEEIIKEGVRTLSWKAKNKTYDIKVKRVGNQEFTSVEVADVLRATIRDLLGKETKGISFKNPEEKTYVEIRGKKAYYYLDKIRCAGGIPSSKEKALMMFSGGIDSPVAAYKVFKRGIDLDFLIIDLGGGIKKPYEVYEQLIKRLKETAPMTRPKIYLVNGKEIIKFLQPIKNTLRQLGLKILFYHIGQKAIEKINKKEKNKLLGLITGEALSQKSTQTLSSLKFINDHSPEELLVLRPLIGMDKKEIIEVARKIGTLELSEQVKEMCNISEGKTTAMPKKEQQKELPTKEEFEQMAEKMVKTLKELKKEEILNKEKKEKEKEKRRNTKQREKERIIFILKKPKTKTAIAKLKKEKNVIVVNDKEEWVEKAKKELKKEENTKREIIFVCPGGIKARETKEELTKIAEEEKEKKTKEIIKKIIIMDIETAKKKLINPK